MVSWPTLIFDTSSINRLTDDPDSAALIGGLQTGFHVHLTFTSVCEIIACKESRRREMLLAVCKRLLASGHCFDPPNVMLMKLIAAFNESPTRFDWATVSVRNSKAENEIARQEIIGDPLSEEEREQARDDDKAFLKVYDEARLAFSHLFASGDEKIPASASELVTVLQSGGAFWTVASNWFSRTLKKTADDLTVRRFVEKCPPFRALMTALCAVQYDRCVRPRNVGPSLKTGRNDTFMSIYLPYCDQFVTDDPGQLRCFREVASVSSLDVKVRTYEEFRCGLLVMGVVPSSVA